MGVGPVETLARYVLQSELYRSDMDVRDAVDAVLGDPIYDAAPEMHKALSALHQIAELTTFSDQFPLETEKASIALLKAQGEEYES